MITREELYKQVWARPAVFVAPELGVSGSYLARVCRRMDVPCPPPGYWARLAAGQIADPPPLPAARPGIPGIWSKSTVKRPPYTRPAGPRRPPAAPQPPVKGVHPLVVAASDHLRSAEVDENGHYLKPAKRLMIDVTTSKDGAGKCLRFANALFLALERRGHRVVIASSFDLIRPDIAVHEGPRIPGAARAWRPMRATVVYIDGMPIGLAVAELGERSHMKYVGGGQFATESEFHKQKKHHDVLWSREMHRPCGRVKLTAYSPIHPVPWRQQWVESVGQPLDKQLDVIVTTLESGALAIFASCEQAGLWP